MEDRLREYMDYLFREVKPTKASVELKEEILQNLIDKYHDLIAEGKTPDAAYNIALASIGDMDELLEGLNEPEKDSNWIPDEEIERKRKKSAVLTSIAIMMYIISVLPPILFEDTRFEDTLGPCLMFVIIAAATGILIYNYMTRPRYQKVEDTIVEDFKEWKAQADSDRRARKAINSAIWSLTVVIYILLSFSTMAWHITWVIFLIAGAIQEIIKAAFELKRQG